MSCANKDIGKGSRDVIGTGVDLGTKRPASSSANESDEPAGLSKVTSEYVIKDDVSSSPRPNKRRILPNMEHIPNYGSKEYWEARYQSHSAIPADASHDHEDDGVSSQEAVETITSHEVTTPGHEWYFTYDDLRPLIMPLILGESDNEDIESEYDEDIDSWAEDDDNEDDDNDNDGDSKVDKQNEECDMEPEKKVLEKAKLPCSEDKTSENIDVQVESSHSMDRRPKRVLEIGCGDKPLGAALLLDLMSYQTNSQTDAKSFVEEVTCIDYSSTVIQGLIEKENTEIKLNNLRPRYCAVDARSLPFQSDSYDLILEKGTLDAMLSDKVDGLSNCVQIVKEMARVTSDGGAILIVSHLNANESKGMIWLEDVVLNGLKADFFERRQLSSDQKSESNEDDKESIWSIEVHGGNGSRCNASDENTEDSGIDDEDETTVFGPAVYIIRKKTVPAKEAQNLFGKKIKNGNGRPELMEMLPVKLSFLSYDEE